MSLSRGSDTALLIGAIAFAVAVFGGMIWWEWSLWSECRAVNSFWYCLRVLS